MSRLQGLSNSHRVRRRAARAEPRHECFADQSSSVAGGGLGSRLTRERLRQPSLRVSDHRWLCVALQVWAEGVRLTLRRAGYCRGRPTVSDRRVDGALRFGTPSPPGTSPPRVLRPPLERDGQWSLKSRSCREISSPGNRRHAFSPVCCSACWAVRVRLQSLVSPSCAFVKEIATAFTTSNDAPPPFSAMNALVFAQTEALRVLSRKSCPVQVRRNTRAI